MSRLTGIVGPSGSGKSTSLRTLDPSETFIIICSKKDLPFPGWKSKYQKFSKPADSDEDNGGNFYRTDSAPRIRSLLKHVSKNRPEIKKLVIDD